jgi:pyrimidine operon attenuation protein/uracil phosphoribosyltransferase
MEKQILNKNDIKLALARMANEISESGIDLSNLFVIGIKDRGDILAARIGKLLESLNGIKVGVSAIDITFYRDDIKLKAYKYVVKDEIQFDIADKHVVLVDDVLFTGRSIRAAIDVLIDTGRPKSIQLAVLVDKGGRELPIQPDYVGKKISVEPDSWVIVKLQEVDGEDKAFIS